MFYKVQEHIFLHLLILILFSSLFFFPIESKIFFLFYLFFFLGFNIYCSIYYSINSFRLRCQRNALLSRFPATTVMSTIYRSKGNPGSADLIVSAELTAVQNWYRNKFIMGSILDLITLLTLTEIKFSFFSARVILHFIQHVFKKTDITVNTDMLHSYTQKNVGFCPRYCVNHLWRWSAFVHIF